ncbi:MAG TPA: glycosyltransferase family 4 protein [Actinomycetota bacterium]
MRLTILTRGFPPAVDGIGDHADHLADALAATGIEVAVVTSAAEVAERSAFAVHPVIERWDARGFGAIASAVAETAPDAINWHYNPFSIGRKGLAPSAGRLARALASRAPLVLSLHELWFPFWRAGARGLAWALGQRAQIRPVLGAATRWVVTTETRERDLRRIDPSKVVRIPTGPSVVPTGKNAREALGLPEGAFVAGHLGGVGPGRDLTPLLAAIERLRREGLDVRLALLGATGPFTPPESVRDAIVLPGPASREDLSAQLTACDVYVHADRAGASAGRRTSIVSALAHGLPLVSYTGPDQSTDLTPGRDVLVVPPVPGALAAVLADLATDRDKARSLGEAARALYEEKFSWGVIARRFAPLLQVDR